MLVNLGHCKGLQVWGLNGRKQVGKGLAVFSQSWRLFFSCPCLVFLIKLSLSGYNYYASKVTAEIPFLHLWFYSLTASQGTLCH